MTARRPVCTKLPPVETRWGKSAAGALKAIGDEFRAGMVFAMNIDLFDPKWRYGETGCVFAETIVITENGARRLHSFPTEFQRLAV